MIQFLAQSCSVFLLGFFGLTSRLITFIIVVSLITFAVVNPSYTTDLLLYLLKISGNQISSMKWVKEYQNPRVIDQNTVRVTQIMTNLPYFFCFDLQNQALIYIWTGNKILHFKYIHQICQKLSVAMNFAITQIKNWIWQNDSISYFFQDKRKT